MCLKMYKYVHENKDIYTHKFHSFFFLISLFFFFFFLSFFFSSIWVFSSTIKVINQDQTIHRIFIKEKQTKKDTS